MNDAAVLIVGMLLGGGVTYLAMNAHLRRVLARRDRDIQIARRVARDDR